MNPQEHVWKAVREAVSHNHAEDKLPKLAEKFLNKLNSIIFKSTFLKNMASLHFVQTLIDLPIRELRFIL